MSFKKAPFWRRSLYLSTHPYFMIRNQNAGELDLEKLAINAKFEGVWIFSHDRSMWLNLGHITKTLRYGKQDVVEASVAHHDYNLIQWGRKLTHYHIHPKFAEEDIFKQLINTPRAQELKSNPSMYRETVGFARNLAAKQVSTPSIEDIKAYTYLIRANSDCQIDFKIASPYGMLSVEFSGHAHLHEAVEMYSRIHQTGLQKYQLGENKLESINKMLHDINHGMRGLFRVSMKYR